MEKTKRVLVWGLMIVTAVLFYISLRTETEEMEYTVLALAIWLVAFMTNKFWKT